MSLTHRQKQALDFIKASISEHGYPPTLRELGENMGIKSTNGVNDHLRVLIRKGYLTRNRDGGKARAISLVTQPGGKERTALIQLRDIASWVRKHPSDRVADALDHFIVLFMQRYPETIQ